MFIGRFYFHSRYEQIDDQAAPYLYLYRIFIVAQKIFERKIVEGFLRVVNAAKQDLLSAESKLALLQEKVYQSARDLHSSTGSHMMQSNKE